ncbi:hypothetical protein [Candidatus Uabimicrobium amorphum]|uniref:Lipoprotein n=1 Tax=Uabimicrobium amorphum TaxID=2596890 RepID=A0A5S9F6M5_UABAM|nr:hypothetical protein [Candidatus Uabimicrobium amorphum]BBM87511.1 hypothetical protein UABAM_05923 [Candidatus Uabimicrobium amorphum]
MNKTLSVFIILLVGCSMLLCSCTQKKGYRGGVRGSQTGVRNVEDIDRAHRYLNEDDDQQRKEQYLEQQKQQEDSYGY